MKFFFFCIFFFAITLFANPIVSFSATPAFSGQELFLKLDEIGKNGNWMRLDTLSIIDPSVSKILKKNKGFLAVWALESPMVKSKVAVLSKKGKSEVLAFYEIEAFDAKPEPLSVHEKLYPENILIDFNGISTNEFVHKDDSDLKLKINDSGLYFSYTKRDKTPLRFDTKFATLTFEEKAKIVEEYRDFFIYEYALMLRAFVQSTSGIFNWQSWHWYLPNWNKKYLISKEEIHAILSSGYPPAMFRLFFVKTSRNVLIEMRTDGNGYYEMDVRLP